MGTAAMSPPIKFLDTKFCETTVTESADSKNGQVNEIGAISVSSSRFTLTKELLDRSWSNVPVEQCKIILKNVNQIVSQEFGNSYIESECMAQRFLSATKL